MQPVGNQRPISGQPDGLTVEHSQHQGLISAVQLQNHGQLPVSSVQSGFVQDIPQAQIFVAQVQIAVPVSPVRLALIVAHCLCLSATSASEIYFCNWNDLSLSATSASV